MIQEDTIDSLYQKNLSKLLIDIPHIDKICEKADLSDKSKTDFLENKELFASMVKDNPNVLVLYGLALGDFYFAAKEWLKKPNHFLVFIEDDARALKRFLHTELAKEVLENDRVQIFFMESFLQIEKIMQKIAWKYGLLNIVVDAHSDYKKNKEDIFLKICEQKQRFCLGTNLLLVESKDFGCCNLENSLSNFLKISKSTSLWDQKNSFDQVPAVICAAGASLQENIPFLKNIQNRALLFAGGSAVDRLSKENIFLHFAALIDPLYHAKNLSYFETPFLYRSSMNSENLSTMYGSKIFVEDCEEICLEKWLMEELRIPYHSFDGGWNVSTFLIAVATWMGCNPIIFVGMDHCLSKEEVLHKKDYLLLKAKNRCNQEIITQADWVVANSWIEEYIKKNKRVTYINTSKEGLLIKNTSYMPFEDLIANLDKQFDLNALCHSAISSAATRSWPKKKMIHLIDKLKEEFLACGLYCDEVLSSPKNVMERSCEEKIKEFSIYPWAFEKYWDRWKHVFEREVVTTPEYSKEMQMRIHLFVSLKRVVNDYLEVLKKVSQKYAKL